MAPYRSRNFVGLHAYLMLVILLYLVVRKQKYDPEAMTLLTPELRKTCVALWVEGDGNCFWRSCARVLWGTDLYWRQLKLVVLAWSSVNVGVLVGEGGLLFRNGLHYDDDVHCRHVYRGPDGKRDDDRDNYASMLQEQVAKFCQDRKWGGDLAGILTTERLGVVLKMASPVDMRARKRADAGLDKAKNYSGRYGLDHFEDQRYSLVKVPSGGRKEITVRGASGEPDIVVDEIAIALVGYSEARVGDGGLSDIPVISADTPQPQLVHYAAIVSTDPDVHVRRPLRMDIVGPSLWTKFVSGLFNVCAPRVIAVVSSVCYYMNKNVLRTYVCSHCCLKLLKY